MEKVNNYEYKGVKSVKVYYDSYSEKQYKDYFKEFNKLYATMNKKPENALKMIDIIYEYYMVFRKYNENWWEYSYYPIPVERRHLDEDDVKSLISYYLFARIFPTYKAEINKRSTIFSYCKMIFDKQLADELAKIALPFHITHSTKNVEKDTKAILKDVACMTVEQAEANDYMTYDFEENLEQLEEKVVADEIIDILQNSKGGIFVLHRFGIKEPLTIAEMSERYNVSIKYVNYWLKKNLDSIKRIYSKKYKNMLCNAS